MILLARSKERCMQRCLTGLLSLGVLACSAGAQSIVPMGYAFSSPPEGQAQGGSFNYFDESGTQLIDGVVGVDDWTADLGNGPAHEWVGWVVANPVIEFTFAEPVSIRRVEIGLNRSESAGIHIPQTVTIGDVATSLEADVFADGNRAWVSFEVNLPLSSSIRIAMNDAAANRWIFTDEIRFYIPEPASLVLAGALAVLALRRR
jgi:hypothetical protein